MQLIEELPNSKATSAPGWAYVPDTGWDPSKASIGASGVRKRARHGPSFGGGELSTRDSNRIAKHLADLDRDSHKDVQIVVPGGKSRDIANRALRGKMTPAVKKIMLSQKTFANHLADEEAALANQPVRPPTNLQRHPSAKSSKASASTSKRAGLAKSRTEADAIEVDPLMKVHGKGEVSDGALANDNQTELDPLLESDIPTLPTPEVLQGLLSSQPIPYLAVRAAPSTSSAPARKFCEICGYWGRVRCMKCGVRVCGRECKEKHEETRCLKFYA